MDEILVTLAATTIVLGLLWIAGKFVGVLPRPINSPKTNARLGWILGALGIMAFWLHSLDRLMESQSWSLAFNTKLVWLIILPVPFFYCLLRAFIKNPDTSPLNSPKTKARFIWILGALGIMGVWLHFLDRLMESQSWSFAFNTNLLGLIILPFPFFHLLLQAFIKNPDSIPLNSPKTNVRLHWILNALVIMGIWLLSLDRWMESQSWSFAFFTNLLLLIILPVPFFYWLLQAFRKNRDTVPAKAELLQEKLPVRPMDTRTES